MKKTISFERLEKITNKINDAITKQDIMLFNKWYKFVKKETIPGQFKKLFISSANQLLVNHQNSFFKEFLEKIKNELAPNDYRGLFIEIFNHKNYHIYDFLKEQLKEDIYKCSWFKENIIHKFYSYQFNHDFENLLNKSEPEEIKGFCDTIHLNGLQLIEMTDIMLDKLSEKDRKNTLEKNLSKSIENNVSKDVVYFFHKLFNVNRPDEKLQEDLLILGLDKYKNLKNNLTISSVQKIEILKSFYSRKDENLYDFLDSNILEFTQAGNTYKNLLKNFLLKEKLDELPQRADKKKIKV